MAERELPVMLASDILGFFPMVALTPVLAILVRRLERTYPQLFEALASHEPCAIGVEPTDLDYRFIIRFGGRPTSLMPAAAFDESLDAHVRGDLATLLGLLDGCLDSDSLFFSRDLTVTGDMGAIVNLRNIIEREALDIFEVVAGMFGPVRRPVRVAALILERRLRKVRRYIIGKHEILHARRQETNSSTAYYDKLTAELRATNERVAKLEVQARRRNRIAGVT